MTWIHRLFAVTTALPLLVWLGAVAGALYLSGVEGCRIDEGNIHPCSFLGMEFGRWAYMLGFYASWGFLILGPISLASAALWGLFAVLSAYLRRRRHRQGQGQGH